jgi:hypothetical protein
MRKTPPVSNSRAARTKAKDAQAPKVATKKFGHTSQSEPTNEVEDFPAALAHCLSSAFPKATVATPVNGWTGLSASEKAKATSYLCREIVNACKRGDEHLRTSYTAIAEVIGLPLCDDPPDKTFVEHWLIRNDYTYFRVQEIIYIFWTRLAVDGI